MARSTELRLFVFWRPPWQHLSIATASPARPLTVPTPSPAARWHVTGVLSGAPELGAAAASARRHHRPGAGHVAGAGVGWVCAGCGGVGRGTRGGFEVPFVATFLNTNRRVVRRRGMLTTPVVAGEEQWIACEVVEVPVVGCDRRVSRERQSK